MIPIISKNTQERAEGYFRLEWKLAIDRSHLMSADRPFLVPVVIDHTREGDERVPDKFRELQWTHLPDGEASAAFVTRIAGLLAQTSSAATEADPIAAPRPGRPAAQASPPSPSVVPAAASPPRRNLVPIIVVALALCVGIGAWATRHAWQHSPSVVPYSSEDRRMTYAVLPFQSPPDDAHAAQVAKATGDEILSLLQDRTELIRVAPQAIAEQAVAHEASLKKLAKLLDVHFLVRGTVARDGDNYRVTVLGIDGDSERVLVNKSLTVLAGATTPRWRSDVRDVTSDLTVEGLQVEVARARDKPVEALDVRDLSFRASVDWWAHRDADGKTANAMANALLKQALALSPDDMYALRTVATINLCDCVNAWSGDPEVQKAVGAAAMEKYLRADPTSPYMLLEKANLYQLRQRWEESLVILDKVLERDPDSHYGLATKAVSLLKLGRAKEAQVIMDGLLLRYPNDWGDQGVSADVAFAQGDYARAAQLAQKATAQMADADLRDSVSGPLRLTLISAEAHLGHIERARAALADLTTMRPDLTTIAAIRKWVHPSADLAGSEELYAGLRLAGLKD